MVALLIVYNSSRLGVWASGLWGHLHPYPYPYPWLWPWALSALSPRADFLFVDFHAATVFECYYVLSTVSRVGCGWTTAPRSTLS